jgi:SagB-type dehydrogenase family enzyme
MGTRPVLFRRAPHLVCYWASDRLVIHNYATAIRVAASPIVSRLLHVCGGWQSLDAIGSELRECTAGTLRSAVDDLVEHSLLIRSDQKPAGGERAMQQWEPWNPAAGFFHFSTKDSRYPEHPAAAARLWRDRGPTSRMPSAVKTYAGAPRVKLPQAAIAGEFPRVLLERRTWREFSPRRVELQELATLLQLTWGVQLWGIVSGSGRIALKTSPSGGARHPGEVYVLALRVKGLERGLYHYAADRHVLAQLRKGATAREVAAYLPGQPWYRSAAALLLMTAVFPREQWRYQFARAYRAVLLDAGHLCQTCCLTATWLGLAPFCSLAFPDSRVEQDLGIDGVSESMLYIAGVGARAAHGWEPWTLAKLASTGKARRKRMTRRR